MRDALIHAFLHAVASKRTAKSEKVVTGPCPLAPFQHEKGTDKKPSFGIFRGPGIRCHCFSCQTGGDLYALLLKLRAYEKSSPSGREIKYGHAVEAIEKQQQDEPLIEEDDSPSYAELALLPPKNQVVVWPETYLEGFEDAYTEEEVHPYLDGRGVLPATARRLDIRWDPNQERICFPQRDFHGRLVGLHGRATRVDAAPKYRVYRWQERHNLTVWMGEHWLDFDRSVVVVESVFDLARVYPVYPNVITPRTANFPHEALRRLDGLKHVVTLSDNDKAGSMFCDHMATLKGVSVQHASIAPYKDPGEAPEEFIRQVLAPLVDLEFSPLAFSLPFC
jgi:DNA primase